MSERVFKNIFVLYIALSGRTNLAGATERAVEEEDTEEISAVQLAG